MYKHYVYRINGTGWQSTENHHTMHEMSGSHDGANSDFCFVFWAKLPPPTNHSQNHKTHFNNIPCIFTEITYQPKMGYIWKFLHCYCKKYVLCIVDQAPKLCIFFLKNYYLITNG